MRLRSVLPALLVASLLTAGAVGVGFAAIPDPVGVRMTMADVAAPTRVSGADLSARPASASRGEVRRTGSAGDLRKAGLTGRADRTPASLTRLPAYQLAKAGAPLVRTPPKPAKAKIPTTPDGTVSGGSFTFQIGTLNILGSQHRGGGTSRAGQLAGAIMGRGVDLVGLQEVQDDQLAVMQNQLSGYTVWPGQALGNQGVRLQIAFRSDLFELADTGSITTTFDHQSRPIPYVLLRERSTNAEFYVVDVHNSPRDQEADRDSATGAEISLLNTLRASGKPVFIMGDTNEHTEFACRVMASTGMVASNGGNASGGCTVGAGPIKIDWILGGGGVSFSGHVVDYGSPIRTATDHAFVHATVTVTPTAQPGDE